MIKIFTIHVALVFSSLLWGNDTIVKTNTRTYQINIQTTVERYGFGNSCVDLFLANLGSNEYQECYESKSDSLAKIIRFGSAGDSCLYYNLMLGKKAELGKKVTLHNEFTVEVSDLAVNFNLIDSIHSYDLSDLNYRKYTGSNYPFIDLRQTELLEISQLLWTKSSDVIDYAKKCYLFVADSFQYGLPLSGFKNLEFTLENKIGDCGNLSSVFITLLRMRDIPARHLIGFRPDGSLHVWADFYLANYGWIPVDITYKMEFPKGNFFGNIEFDNVGFIVQRGIGLQISTLDSPMRIAGLQTYTYRVSAEKENERNLQIDRKVSCKLDRMELD